MIARDTTTTSSFVDAVMVMIMLVGDYSDSDDLALNLTFLFIQEPFYFIINNELCDITTN